MRQETGATGRLVKTFAVCPDAAMSQPSTRPTLDKGYWTLRFGTEYARRLRRTWGACSNICTLADTSSTAPDKRLADAVTSTRSPGFSAARSASYELMIGGWTHAVCRSADMMSVNEPSD